jgi:Anti-sigma-K factor rskA, C-terminal
MDKEKFKELCSLYFLDALNEEELQEFNEALKSGNEEFIKIYNDLKTITFYLPFSAEQVEPSAKVKTELFKKIRQSQTNNIRTRSAFDKMISFLGLENPKFAFGYTFIFLLGLIIAIYFIYQKNNTIKSQETAIVELTNKIEKDQEILNILSSKKIDIVIMNGLEVNPAGYGKIIFNPADKTAILQVSNLPKTAEDKDYQLWTIQNKKPLDNGIFSIKRDNEKTYFLITNIKVSELNDINAFAITLEPKGGVPQPTGKMYLLGNANL